MSCNTGWCEKIFPWGKQWNKYYRGIQLLQIGFKAHYIWQKHKYGKEPKEWHIDIILNGHNCISIPESTAAFIFYHINLCSVCKVNTNSLLVKIYKLRIIFSLTNGNFKPSSKNQQPTKMKEWGKNLKDRKRYLQGITSVLNMMGTLYTWAHKICGGLHKTWII